MSNKYIALLFQEAMCRKLICLYILEKKKNNQFLFNKDFKKITPDIIVTRLISLNTFQLFEYDEMICNQIKELIGSFLKYNEFWSDEIIKQLLIEIGVSKIEIIETNFNQLGYRYKIRGKYYNELSFSIYNIINRV